MQVIYLADGTSVKDLASDSLIYVIGLEILSQMQQKLFWVLKQAKLVHLIETNREEAVKSSYGSPYGNFVAISRGFGDVSNILLS